MYCDLIFTGKTFNGKKIYKCEKCGLEAGLEDPNTNILCFNQALDAYKAEYAAIKSEQENVDNLYEQDIINSQRNDIENLQQDLAPKEEIERRMEICKKCEYYKDDSCMLCGCRVVRDKNYQNKLANKNANCPDNRWGPIKD